MSASCLDRHSEGAALPLPTLHTHCSAVGMYQFLHQGQSNSCSFVGARFGTLDPMKPIKEMRQFHLWNANSGIGHDEFGEVAMPFESDTNSAFESMLEGIGEKV